MRESRPDETMTLLELGYQRNGVSGEGFYHAVFDYQSWGWTTSNRDDGSMVFRLHAIIPSEVVEVGATEDAKKYTGLHRVYVFDPTDLDSHWRGDRMGYNLVPLVKAHTDACWEHTLKSNPSAALPASVTFKAL